MMSVSVKVSDKSVSVPETTISYFDIKNVYIGTGKLAPEMTEALFALTDRLIDRLVISESERFRNNY